MRRLAREMDSAASRVWGMLCEGVIQGLELTLLLLGDLYGLAACQPPDSTLGLNVRNQNILEFTNCGFDISFDVYAWCRMHTSA